MGSSSMKKVSFAFLLTMLCALPALAQTGAGYTFDNFDFVNGVQVKVEPPQVVKKGSKKNRRNKPAAASVNNAMVEPTLLSYSNGMAMTASRSLDGFTTGDARIDSIIVDAATRNGVDPVLIYATMHQESSFKARAMSNKGARGLMQLMPGTASRFGVANIWDPKQNIEGGTRYMRFLLDMFDGDVNLALAGYNAGEGAVLKFGRQIPPYNETQEYVRRISRRYALMRDPETAHAARTLTRSQVAAVRSEKPVPLTIYEREVFAVRLPDGRLQLVSQ
jgi:soluble lytic murein transglycosylase-like protein